MTGTVKALEWERNRRPGVHFVKTLIGTYAAYADGTLQLDGEQLSFVAGRAWHETEAAAQDHFNGSILSALTASASEPATMDERMKAAGMIPLSDLLAGNTPLKRWMAHTGVRDMDSFENWLASKHREFLSMRVAYELGDKDQTDELYEWVFAHAAVFGEVAANFRQAKECANPASTPDGAVTDAMVESAAKALVPYSFAAFEHGFSAEYGRGDPNDHAREAARAALSAALSHPADGWRDIESAPKDGTWIAAWGKPTPSAEEGPYVTRWQDYGKGSTAHADWKRGKGPKGTFWHSEPMHGWTNGWSPKAWSPLPAASAAKPEGE